MEDKSKILIAKLILKITFIMIIISVSLKLLGFNYFEADYNNQILLTLSNILDKLKGKPFFNIILLFTQTYIILRLACKNKHIKLYYFASFSTSIICIWGQVLIYDYFWINNPTMASIIYSIFSFLILIGTPVIIDIKSAYESTTQSKNYLIKLINNVWVRIKKPLLIFFMIMIYQVIVLFLRNLTPNERYDTVYNSLLNFDYIILLFNIEKKD